MTSSASGSSSGGAASTRQEVRQLSREVTALVTVSNPGPRFSALATLSDSEDSGDGVGVGGKKRRHRAAAAPPPSDQLPSELGDDEQQQPASATGQDSLYDAQGRIAVNGQDACDCLTLGCPGCYYPCVKCGSAKCGFECRVGRNSYVKSVTVESVGNLVIHNRLITGVTGSDSDVE